MMKKIFILIAILCLCAACSSSGEQDNLASSASIPTDTAIPTAASKSESAPFQDWIVFTKDLGEVNDIYLLSPELDKTIALGLSGLYIRSIAWSPDKQQIALVTFPKFFTTLYTLDLSCVESAQDCGASLKSISTDKNSFWGDLDWSPDGKYISLSEIPRAHAQEVPKLKIINAETGTSLDIPEIKGWGATWGPDSQSLLFTAPSYCNKDCQGELYIFDIFTNELTHFEIPTLEDAYNGTWSPDGEKIAFSSSEFFLCEEQWCATPNLYLINADGSGLHQLASGGHSPAWSPDGGKIVFQQDEGLYIIHADGSGLMQIDAPEAVGNSLTFYWAP